jgi:hypothetical protein
MNNPQMPALLVSHKRPGFYCRVIEEGEIGAGDEIVKVADGPEHVTVQEIDGLLYLPGRSADRLQRALRIPSLSAGWKASLATLLAAEEKPGQGGNAGLAPSSTPPPAWPGFRSLRVLAVRRESIDVLSFVLESEDRSPYQRLFWVNSWSSSSNWIATQRQSCEAIRCRARRTQEPIASA